MGEVGKTNVFIPVRTVQSGISDLSGSIRVRRTMDIKPVKVKQLWSNVCETSEPVFNSRNRIFEW